MTMTTRSHRFLFTVFGLSLTVFADDVPDLLISESKPSLPSPPEQTLRRRRRIKGYAVCTDDECISASASESEAECLLSPSQALHDDDAYSATFVDDDDDDTDDDLSMTPHPSHLTLSLSHRKHTATAASSDDLVFRAASGEIDVVSFASTTNARGVKVWIATARDMLLPQYTEKVTSAPRHLNNAEKVLTTFTLYAELAAAEKEADFEPIMRRLQSEWAVVGGLVSTPFHPSIHIDLAIADDRLSDSSWLSRA
jgi:hypothetical protein